MVVGGVEAWWLYVLGIVAWRRGGFACLGAWLGGVASRLCELGGVAWRRGGFTCLGAWLEGLVALRPFLALPCLALPAALPCVAYLELLLVRMQPHTLVRLPDFRCLSLCLLPSLLFSLLPSLTFSLFPHALPAAAPCWQLLAGREAPLRVSGTILDIPSVSENWRVVPRCFPRSVPSETALETSRSPVDPQIPWAKN